MKFSGTLTVKAPRAEVYKKVRDARFFASCVDGVSELAETAPDTYAAVFATKVAYMTFKFKVTVQVTRALEPSEIEAKVEGTPLGVVGRLTGTSVTKLSETQVDGSPGTAIDYEVETALTGKLGSLGQPVLRSKAKEMERQFAARLAAAFAAPAA
jgi:carbon monoxide dehydrogenase subunit G